MQLWVEAIKHIQHAAKQATYAEHTSERTQASPDTAKHKLPAHWSWFLCVKPDTAAPTGQGDGLLKDVRPFQYARMSMIPFITGTFLRRGEGVETNRQVVATFIAENTKRSQHVTSSL